MIKTTDCAKAYTEILKIIEFLPDSEFIKIPNKLLNQFEENCDKEYTFNIESEEDFMNKKISKEAEYILYFLYKNYLSSKEEQENLKKLEANANFELEKIKREKYNPNTVFLKKKKSSTKEKKEIINMFTEEQALYQTKLVLDCLPLEEYMLIPKKIIKFIESNMSVDETIKLDPDKELKEQHLDEKTIDLLDMIMNSIDEEIQIRNGKKDNNTLEINDKLLQAKKLMEDYKNLINLKQKELENLKITNNYLNNSLNKIPNFIKRLFIKKENLKYLKETNK